MVAHLSWATWVIRSRSLISNDDNDDNDDVDDEYNSDDS